ncbi:MAG: hypothetical protein HOO00_07635 [Rhodospirillaceae bacterium]|jgi:cholesterol transport system auxiliary component|nr:hypothetical protein [Rhodospirillaceae bacterium]MBT5751644.1 hypothetical protein [Rhodospirillaceae bacterium]
MNARRLINAFIIIPFLMVGLAACAQPKVPDEHFYRLDAEMPEGLSAPLFSGVMMVEPFRGNGLTRERPLLYSTADTPLEVKQYNYHYWIDTPTLMVQDKVVGFAREANIAETVITPDMRILPDYIMNGHIKRLDRIVGRNGSTAVVEIEFNLMDAHSDRPVLMKNYLVEEKAGDDMPSTIEAFKRAFTKVFAELKADLEAGS